MSSRSRAILNMVISNATMETIDRDEQYNFDSNSTPTNINTQQFVANDQQDTTNFSSGMNSIADSQPDLAISLLDDIIIDETLHNQNYVVGPSSDSSSDSSSTSEDFSSDDSVKDPNFVPDSEVCVELEEQDSPQPGPSWAHQSIIDTALPLDSDVETVLHPAYTDIMQTSVQSSSIEAQSSSIQIQPLSVEAQSPSIDSYPPSVEPQPLSRKRKANPASWKRNVTKALINSGKAHTTMTKNIEAKVMGPSCTDKCKLKCGSEFSVEQRQDIFEKYWRKGDLKSQRQFISENMTEIEPKYRYIRVGSTRKNFNHAYYLPKNNTRTRVCKLFFMNTLAISDKSIRTVVKKKSEGMLGIEMEDMRGKHGKQFKLEADLKNGVREHINSIPRIDSHYCRARSKRQYIEGGKTVADLHRDYIAKNKEEGKPYASYKIYYNIFVNEYNISFWQPKKDQCDDCTAFKNSDDKTLLQEKYDLHLKEKTLARAEKEMDKNNVSDNFVVCVYDLQAVMPSPRGEVSSFYYISKLNLLNFTITELDTNKTSCFVWHEGEGARGVNEIGSCVLMYLENLNEKASTDFDVVFYSDNCCGQQKNKFMLSLYQYAVNNLSKLRSITHKFLIKGHTQNEGDAAHSLIQRNISRALKSSPIYVPDQYVTLIKTAKKTGSPFVVRELTHENFLDLKHLAFGNYTTTEDGEKVKWADIKVLQVHRDLKNKFSFKTSYDSDDFISVSTVTKKQKNTYKAVAPKNLYSQKLKISESKKQGILKLIEKNIIPKYYQSFYESL